MSWFLHPQSRCSKSIHHMERTYWLNEAVYIKHLTQCLTHKWVLDLFLPLFLLSLLLLKKTQVSSVAQSRPTLCYSRTAALLASLSIANSWSLFRLMSMELVKLNELSIVITTVEREWTWGSKEVKVMHIPIRGYFYYMRVCVCVC